jgi:hypothetical protein
MCVPTGSSGTCSGDEVPLGAFRSAIPITEFERTTA